MTNANKPRPESLASRLRKRGFDKSQYDPSSRTTKLGCSQCQALAINGVACHERGCPNDRKHQAEDA
jgi:hypothetical protein